MGHLRTNSPASTRIQESRLSPGREFHLKSLYLKTEQVLSSPESPVSLGSFDVQDLALGWYPSQTRETSSPLHISPRQRRTMSLGSIVYSRIDQGSTDGYE
jgi:hypothetical protein